MMTERHSERRSSVHTLDSVRTIDGGGKGTWKNRVNFTFACEYARGRCNRWCRWHVAQMRVESAQSALSITSRVRCG
ncbi:hypothetical protein SCLCIDRAFT_995172 [Scleroderma citrinum Foug A]|uniref:Uncharacterized protein n=1 Tax=Scleroderma citrinum Foug A TaxID=1036808 RepID=A0A0C3A4E0_9AGAM|nr:hypothetical protein SCLCIDRAFT_995172 [Scleroderma citrinum Foug A]